ncbi:MAG: hypothetical protein K5838_08330 [Elusimicrobiales bacterium]|nr:hypothetical protein [Elusimicrobiales bacterium]
MKILFMVLSFFLFPILPASVEAAFFSNSIDISDPMYQPPSGKILSDSQFMNSEYEMHGYDSSFRTYILQEDISYGVNDDLAVSGGIQRVGSKMEGFHAHGRDHYSYKNIWDIGIKFKMNPSPLFTLGLQGHYKNVQSEKSAGEDTDGIYGAARLSYSCEIADPFLELSYIRDFKESDDVARGGISLGLFKDFGRYTGLVNVYRSHIAGSSHLISYGAGTAWHYKFTESLAAGLGLEIHLDSREAGGAYSEIENAITGRFLIKTLL